MCYIDGNFILIQVTDLLPYPYLNTIYNYLLITFIAIENPELCTLKSLQNNK